MIKATEKASKILIRDFGEIEKLQVSKKGPKDFVTNSDIKTAGASGGLVPSFAHGMAQGNTMKAALQDVITEHFNSDMSSVDAANALADSVLDNM